MPTTRALEFSVIFLSLLPTIRPMSGPTSSCSSWTTRVGPKPSPESHRTISVQPGNVGGILSIVGTVWLRRTLHWWQRRFEHQLQLSDMIRIDHFRGFQACWSIPASEETAVNGHWQEVPGRKLFDKLFTQGTNLPIIAEDLGVITPEVEKLRDDFGFPGMKHPAVCLRFRPG